MSRQEKITQALKKEVSCIIHDELKDPRIGFVTITRVELTQDMRHAKIFFSVLGDDKAYEKTTQALNSALGFIRRLVAQRIKLRFAPELAFKEDRSAEYSVRIQQALDKIKEEDASRKKSNRQHKK